MTVVDRLRAALDSDGGFAEPDLLPVAAVGLSIAHDGFRLPLAASDDVASYAERLQFTLGIGPCLEALRQPSPVRVTGHELQRRRPTLYQEVTRHTPYRSIVSLPMLRFPSGSSGAIDLYLVDADAAAVLDTEQAEFAAAYVGARLAGTADWAGTDEEPGPAWISTPAAQRRMQVRVAMGVLNVQLELSTQDAMDLMRGYAYANGGVLDDVAAHVVDGTLSPDVLQP